MDVSWIKLSLVFLLLSSHLYAQNAARPFPQHVQYTKGSIKPNQIPQAQLDRLTLNFYNQWKKRYVKAGCHPGEFYVWYELKGKECVSEGQGYGMIISVLMAGADPSSKSVYDGLYKYYKAHPGIHPYLMAWAQNKNCADADKSSASDGDLDIAYSLLMADKQWGSEGRINYLKEAKKMIAVIMQHEVNLHTYSILLSDAVEYDSKDYNDTRSSDFMPANFRAFENAMQDARWGKVINNGYKIFGYMEQTYSQEAGLIPDFICHVNKNPAPAPPHYLESRFDGSYYYNACRVPWRIATDYLLTGDIRAKTINEKINRWMRETTKGNPDNISAGYTLAGNDLKGHYFEALSFIGPFAVSAMVDKKNQQWLNAVWQYLVHFRLREFDYYDNSVKLLNMIILSGNYWKVG